MTVIYFLLGCVAGYVARHAFDRGLLWWRSRLPTPNPDCSAVIVPLTPVRKKVPADAPVEAKLGSCLANFWIVLQSGDTRLTYPATDLSFDKECHMWSDENFSSIPGHIVKIVLRVSVNEKAFSDAEARLIYDTGKWDVTIVDDHTGYIRMGQGELVDMALLHTEYRLHFEFT